MTFSTKVARKNYTYSESLAYSLIDFATVHKDFARFLVDIIPKRTTKEPCLQKKNTGKNIFTLQDERQATHRASWLLYMLEHGYLIDTNRVATLLSSWARTFEREEPKAIILGLKYGIEPFGVWGEPNRKVHPMNVLISDTTFKNTSKGKLLQETAKVSHTLVTKGILQAQGNTRRMEPELRDWLFGEKQLHFYKTSKQTMEAMHLLLKEWDAPHVTLFNTKNVLTYLGIGPTVYLEDTGYSDALKKIS